MSESDKQRRQLPGPAERLVNLAEQTFGSHELANRWLNSLHPRIWYRSPISLAHGTTEQHTMFKLLLEIDKDILAPDPEPKRWGQP